MALIDELVGQVVYDYNLDQIKKWLQGFKPATIIQKNQMLREWAQFKGIILTNQDYKDIT